MTYKLTIEQKPTYLHAVVTGLNSKENVARYLEEVLNECKARNCSRLLIEERLEGPRLGTLDVFEIASEGSMRAFGMLTAIAYVDINAKGDLMHFAETVAVNRALPVVVFSSVADAEKWLMGHVVTMPFFPQIHLGSLDPSVLSWSLSSALFNSSMFNPQPLVAAPELTTEC
jgi:hypothetical protein